MRLIAFFVLLLAPLTRSTVDGLQAQEKFATEEQFHELFITAGYSTAFGAALGTATLGLSREPDKKLHFVVMGASIGFIIGSLWGTYIIFNPMLYHSRNTTPLPSLKLRQEQPFMLSALIDSKTSRLTGVSLDWLAWQF